MSHSSSHKPKVVRSLDHVNLLVAVGKLVLVGVEIAQKLFEAFASA